MENQTLAPEILPSQNPKQSFMVWIITGIVILTIVVAVGLFSAKFLNRSSSPSQISSYPDCLAAKGSIVQESYPATCVTASGRRFIQPISSPTPESAEPTANPIADWKTYNNNQYKFTFKHPKDWQVISSAEETKPQEIVFAYDSDTKDAYLERNPGAFDQSQKSDVVINGVQTTRIKNKDVYAREHAIIPLTNGTLIITGTLDLAANQKQISVFDQILSTFKFIY